MFRFFVLMCLVMLYAGMAITADAAILIPGQRHNASTAGTQRGFFPNTARSLTFREKTRLIKKLFIKRSPGSGRKSHYDALSIGIMALFLLGVIAVTIVSPDIPSGLALLLLYISSFATSLAAIILGGIGLNSDQRQGMAIAGMVTGILVLIIMLLITLLLLAVTGTIAF